MKKLFFLFALSSFSQSLFSQSFVDTTKRWSVTQCVASAWGADICFAVTYKLEGDTTIGSHIFKKLLSSDSAFTNWYLVGAMRDSGQKVYYHDFWNEYLLYDFGANVGDTIDSISFCTDNYLIVDSVDTVMIGGQARRRLIFDFSASCSYVNEWVEGIGSNHGLVNNLDVHGTFIWDYWEKLVCYWQDDTLRWMNPDFNTCYYVTVGVDELTKTSPARIYPNPVHDRAVVELAGGRKKWTWTLYNSLGQVVSEEKNIDRNAYHFKRGGLTEGIYLYRIHSGGALISSGKFCIE